MQNLLRALFEANVIKYGNRIAIEAGDYKYSYNDFAQLVHSITNSIKENGIQNKAIIVLNDHTLFSYASILAINFSGNTILPIDLKWPNKRIQDIVKKTKPAGILVSDFDEDTSIRIKDMNAGEQLFIFNSSTCAFVRMLSEVEQCSSYYQVAYIISTSGTTGIPKGVPVKQESLHAFIRYFQLNFDFNAEDRFLQVFDITFDVAYFSFFMPLCFGACCCVLTQNKALPKYLLIIDDLIKRSITVVSMVSTVLHFVRRYIKQNSVHTVRYSILTGDILYHLEAVEWQKFVPISGVYNFYGPSEATIFCTQYKWQENQAKIESKNDLVPIGLTFPGIHYKVIDESYQEVVTGEKGELAISGVQVIDNYIGEELADKFFTINENEQPIKYYKTGDMVSINASGNICLHGRMDYQVKINGYRIELDEVQYALQQVTDQKCVVLKMERDHISYLRAVIEGDEQDVQQVQDKLSELLPEYMIPTEIIFIKELPVNENGKVNKRSLQSFMQ